MGLWIAPDFSEVEARRAPPPRVNHDKVIFTQLRDALQNTFKYGPHVEIFVPNDTIDQVTIHMRLGLVGNEKHPPEAALCRDFGQTMLEAFASAQNGVIDVRSAWLPLHSVNVQDRSFAPPPSLLPFVIEAVDFEDAQIWTASTRPCIGLEPFDLMKAVMGEKTNDDEEGTLPPKLLSDLHKIYGSPFKRFCLLSRLASDPPPKEYGFGTF